MDATRRPLPFKPDGLVGLSEKLIAIHHQSNYGGAVKRLAAIRARLRQSDRRASGLLVQETHTVVRCGTSRTHHISR